VVWLEGVQEYAYGGTAAALIVTVAFPSPSPEHVTLLLDEIDAVPPGFDPTLIFAVCVQPWKSVTSTE
jgi:hypothetical protein